MFRYFHLIRGGFDRIHQIDVELKARIPGGPHKAGVALLQKVPECRIACAQQERHTPNLNRNFVPPDFCRGGGHICLSDATRHRSS